MSHTYRLSPEARQGRYAPGVPRPRTVLTVGMLAAPVVGPGDPRWDDIARAHAVYEETTAGAVVVEPGDAWLAVALGQELGDAALLRIGQTYFQLLGQDGLSEAAEAA